MKAGMAITETKPKQKRGFSISLVWWTNVNNFSMKTRYKRKRNLFEEQLAFSATQPENLIVCLFVSWDNYLKALQLACLKLDAAKLKRKWTVSGNLYVIDSTSPLSMKAKWRIM